MPGISSTSAPGTASRIRPATSASGASGRSTSDSFAPSWQNSRPVAAPMPPAPPVAGVRGYGTGRG